MGIAKDQIFKEIRPKLPAWLEEDEREELLEEIGDYVVTTMLDKLGDGISPVEGGGQFRQLSEDYADSEKGGDRTANMELEGDMLSALTYEINFDRVRIGIFEPDQAIKAYGHTTGFEGHPFLEGKAPKRKIIPGAKESFVSEIQEGIDSLIEEFLDARKDSEATGGA